MKTVKIIIRVCLIVALTGGLMYVLDGIFSPKYITENIDGNVTAEFYNVKTPIDAAYFGSSTVYDAIPADFLWHEYGIASYTRANASQTLWQSYYLIKDTLRTNRPQLITVDMSFMKYGEEFVEEPSNRKMMDGMRFSLDKIRCAKVSMWEGEDIYSYIFPVLRFHSRWNDLKDEDFRYAFKRPAVTYDGYIMEFDETEEDISYEPPEDEDRDFPEKAKLYLNKIIDLCRREDIDLLLMKTPTFANNWYPSYDRILTGIAEENENCEYLNFDYLRDELDLDIKKDYVDGFNHLNNRGAEKFSRTFGKYISEKYELPDHRDDQNYAVYWDKQYERYEKAKSEFE